MPGLWRISLALLFVAGVVSPTSASVVEHTSTPYAGVTYSVHVELVIPARIHVVEIDLTSSEISLHATEEGDRGTTPSTYAAQSGAQIVVNGDYFSPVDFSTAGLAMGNAQVWSGSSDDNVSGFVRFDRNADHTHVSISPPEEVVELADLVVGTQGVVGGRPMVVRAGISVATFNCADTVAMACERAPRSAVAISESGSTLWIAVVDGWQESSHGMTAAELGTFLESLGAHDALMLDGGGAATLVIAAEGGLVSSPSDGVERVVANHLGVHHGSLPPGEMVGLVRERDIYDITANIEGATVELDDGRLDVTNVEGRYSFANVTPRYACATASKAGYRPETRCRQIASGEMGYNSIPLFPYSDFIDAAPGTPDAGPPDASGPISDANPLLDAPDVDAGGNGFNGDCVCVAGGRDPGPGSTRGAGLLVLLIAWFLMRKRRAVR